MKRFIFALMTSILGLVLQMAALTMGAMFIDPKVALLFSVSFLVLLFISNLVISWGSSFVLQKNFLPAPVKKKKLPPTQPPRFLE
jgi:hypothetical protein